MRICFPTYARALAASALAWIAGHSFAQGLKPDTDGHCLSDSSAVFACWNFQAGSSLGESIASYPEFLPNLRGWDFRVNLPHVRFQRLRDGPGTPTTMVGVIEDATPLELHQSILGPTEYGHRSNAIWLFREQGGRVFFAQLPSRRSDLATNRVQNAATLTNAWFPVGGIDSPRFQSFRVAAAVVGRGLNATTVHVVAVDDAFRLWHNRLLVDRPQITSWTNAWRPLNAVSRGAASLAAIDGGKVGLSWVDREGELRVQTFEANVWSDSVVVAEDVERAANALVWDGKSLHVFFSAGGRLRHSTRAPGGAFSQPESVSSLLPLFEGEFDAVAFNGGVHVAMRTRTGDPANSAVFYTNTKSPSGWTIPSETGLVAAGAPRIGTLYDNLFVVAANPSGRIAYARKDPNSVDNRITGGALADRWLEPGLIVDAGGPAPMSEPELLAFNSDLYLTANRKRGFVDGSAQIVNFGRAAMKQLLTSKWEMNLLYGDFASAAIAGTFGGAGEIRMIGDFNGDRRTDLIRFAQKTVAGSTGPAPVFVRRVIGTPEVGFTLAADEMWHDGFSPQGEVPLTGDFNGDGRDDVVTFAQKQQRRPDGTVIGPAPVRVALSDGTAFGTARVWHTFFSLKGEIPLAGDFNGDAKQDIITFTQTLQRNADGTIIGQAPVWVALSNGSSFDGSRVWHTFFSLKGEIPMVGDFNGDGRDDIATFVQKPHRDAAGNVIAQAPVWVALSDGTRFGQSRIWHNFFAPKGELPRVADLDLDGKEDIVTFLQDRGQGVQARNVYVAFSTGSRFQTSTMFASDQARQGTVPYFGAFEAKSLVDFTGDPNDAPRLIPDLYVFEPNGTTRIARGLGELPFQTGAPWERYKWFPEKGLGAASVPEWIYQTGPDHCLEKPFRFILSGAGGSATESATMVSSVRSGGRAEHVLEELGHALFAHCLQANRDPFNIFKLIYETPMSAGGLDANRMPGCNRFDDCRDPEHFFLQLIKQYRLHGDEFRQRINQPINAVDGNRRRLQYLWLKRHWYRGAEFKSGPSRDPLIATTHGLLCLPGECAIAPAPTQPPPTREECLTDCNTQRDECLAGGERPAVCNAQARRCRNACPP